MLAARGLLYSASHRCETRVGVQARLGLRGFARWRCARWLQRLQKLCRSLGQRAAPARHLQPRCRRRCRSCHPSCRLPFPHCRCPAHVRYGDPSKPKLALHRMPGALGLSPAAATAQAGSMRPALLLIDMQVGCAEPLGLHFVVPLWDTHVLGSGCSLPASHTRQPARRSTFGTAWRSGLCGASTRCRLCAEPLGRPSSSPRPACHALRLGEFGAVGELLGSPGNSAFAEDRPKPYPGVHPLPRSTATPTASCGTPAPACWSTGGAQRAAFGRPRSCHRACTRQRGPTVCRNRCITY